MPNVTTTATILLLGLVFLLWKFDWSASQYHAAGSVAKANVKEPRIAIITFITDQKSYIHLSLKNKAHYAQRHGYDLIIDYESHSSRGTTWLKFDMVSRLIKKEQYDWIWWMDFDTLITNTDIKVADIISESLANVTKPNEIDLLLTDDCNGLNDGSFIVRSSPRSIDFLNRVRDIHDTNQVKDVSTNDQESMRDFLKTKYPEVKHAIMIPQWKINAFPEEIRCFDKYDKGWEKGMFVIHFAGAWAHVKGEDPTGDLMRKYEKEIMWGPDPSKKELGEDH